MRLRNAGFLNHNENADRHLIACALRRSFYTPGDFTVTVFQTLKELQEVTFAEVPVIERTQPSGHIVAAMEVSGVRIQVYEGADKATLQAILQAAKSC